MAERIYNVEWKNNENLGDAEVEETSGGGRTWNDCESRKRSRFSVQTKDGLLKVLELQIPGEKTNGCRSNFLRGYQVKIRRNSFESVGKKGGSRMFYPRFLF